MKSSVRRYRPSRSLLLTVWLLHLSVAAATLDTSCLLQGTVSVQSFAHRAVAGVVRSTSEPITATNDHVQGFLPTAFFVEDGAPAESTATVTPNGSAQDFLPKGFYDDDDEAPLKATPPPPNGVYGEAQDFLPDGFYDEASDVPAPKAVARAEPTVLPPRPTSTAEQQETADRRAEAAKSCLVGAWSDWSSCEEEAGDALRSRVRTRTRPLVQPQLLGGQPCPALIIRELCSDLWRAPELPGYGPEYEAVAAVFAAARRAAPRATPTVEPPPSGTPGVLAPSKNASVPALIAKAHADHT